MALILTEVHFVKITHFFLHFDILSPKKFNIVYTFFSFYFWNTHDQKLGAFSGINMGFGVVFILDYLFTTVLQFMPWWKIICNLWKIMRNSNYLNMIIGIENFLWTHFNGNCKTIPLRATDLFHWISHARFPFILSQKKHENYIYQNNHAGALFLIAT